MVPPAPVTFSTTTACPRAFVMRCAMMRAMVSVGPPAANGTTMVTVRVGKSWAGAASAAAQRAAAARRRSSKRRGIIVLRERLGAGVIYTAVAQCGLMPYVDYRGRRIAPARSVRRSAIDDVPPLWQFVFLS